MEHPEILFLIITILLLLYFAWSLVLFISTHKFILFIRKTILISICIGFSYIWFVPIEIGWRFGLLPVCKFRFQVFEFDIHDYSGYGDFNDLFIRCEPKKYGSNRYS